MAYHPFKGKIQIQTTHKVQESLVFNVEPENANVCDIIMRQFNALKLSEAEKKDLCANYRKELYQFQNVDTNAISKYANDLIESFKSLDKKSYKVVAGGLGSYICLAAIFSGKIPKDLNVEFTLSSVPLSLFPRKLVRNKPKRNCNVTFLFKDDSWLKNFKSLYSCPKHMKLAHSYVMDKTFEYKAA